MAKYRPINTSFWDDDYILELNSVEKLIYLFLLTNANTTLCGIYTLSIGYAYRITGVEKNMVIEIFNKFIQDKKIKYFKGWVRVLNTQKYQSKSPKIKSGIDRELSCVPEDVRENLYSIDTVSHPIDTVPTNVEQKPKPDTISIPIDKPVLKPILKLNNSSNEELEAAPRTFGKEEINKTLLAIKLEVGVDDFKESQKQQRIAGQNLYRLMMKITPQEFKRRIQSIKEDDFKSQHVGSLKYLYREIKAFVDTAPKSYNVTI